MQRLQNDYLAAYRSLRLIRDGNGVLLAEFHSNGGPFTFTAYTSIGKRIAVRSSTQAGTRNTVSFTRACGSAAAGDSDSADARPSGRRRKNGGNGAE